MCKGLSVLTCVTDIIPIARPAVLAGSSAGFDAVEAERPRGADMVDLGRMLIGRSSACSKIRYA
jgi:hypothetical protein